MLHTSGVQSYVESSKINNAAVRELTVYCDNGSHLELGQATTFSLRETTKRSPRSPARLRSNPCNA